MFQVHLYISTDHQEFKEGRGCWGYALEFVSQKSGTHTRCVIGDSTGTHKGLLLQAVKHACGRITGDSEIIIHTDSAFVADVFNKWYEPWVHNKWVGANGKEVKYKWLLEGIQKNTHVRKLSAVCEEKHIYASWLMSTMKGSGLGPGCTKEIKAQ